MTRSCWPLHGVKLRVTNATGEELDEYLVRRRIGKLNFVHHQRLFWFNKNRRPTFCGHCCLLARRGFESRYFD